MLMHLVELGKDTGLHGSSKGSSPLSGKVRRSFPPSPRHGWMVDNKHLTCDGKESYEDDVKVEETRSCSSDGRPCVAGPKAFEKAMYVHAVLLNPRHNMSASQLPENRRLKCCT